MVNYLQIKNNAYICIMKNKKRKTDLGVALFKEKKKMNDALLEQWDDWRKEANSELTDRMWREMILGYYISKNNLPFAMEALQKGRELNKEFEAQLKKAVA